MADYRNKSDDDDEDYVMEGDGDGDDDGGDDRGRRTLKPEAPTRKSKRGQHSEDAGPSSATATSDFDADGEEVCQQCRKSKPSHGNAIIICDACAKGEFQATHY
jgi:hypothetical protein